MGTSVLGIAFGLSSLHLSSQFINIETKDQNLSSHVDRILPDHILHLVKFALVGDGLWAIKEHFGVIIYN